MATVLTERIEELRNDRRHGASWMARRAVETLVEVAGQPAGSTEKLLARLDEASRGLALSRPGVGAVEGTLGRLLAAAHREAHLPLEEFKRFIEEEAQGLLDGRRRAAASIAIQLRERLQDAVVLTHSASATVREALVYTPPGHVICTVTGPHEEGREFAEELTAEGLGVDLVEDDDAVGEFEHASLLLVGADTVFRDGTLCNKIGTHRLAEAAHERGVPMIVACEVIKLAPFDADDAPPMAKPVAELFDFTPPELIDLVVTEEGAYPSEEVRTLVDRTPFLREGYTLLGAT